MHSFSRLAAILLAAASVRADFVVSSYDVLAPDSSEVRRLYGASTFSNPASRTKVQVLEKGVLRFEVDTIRSEATGTYTANVGLLHPLKRDWSPLPLNSVTAISFDIRLDRIPTLGFEVSLGSDRVSKEDLDAGHSYGVLLTKAGLPTAATWATVTLDLTDFAPPPWWTPTKGFPSRDTALTAVRFLQFAPRTTYTGAGVGPTLPEIVVELRNITLVFDSGLPIFPLFQEGCLDSEGGLLLDDFMDGDRTNKLGGSWYAYSDTSTLPNKSKDSARGTSTVRTTVQPGNELFGDPGFLSLEAGLNKHAGPSGDWRPYAGWAAITTDFGEGKALNVSEVGSFTMDAWRAFSFALRLQKSGPQILGIRFKVNLEGIPEEKSHEVFISSDYLEVGNASYLPRVCVRAQDLRQPYWVADPVPFSTRPIRSLTWEARIVDEIDSTKVRDTVAFSLTNVSIHLASSLFARRATSRASFAASYRDGILSLDSRADLDQIRIVSSSGRIEASIPAGTTRFARPLDRGTWFVIARTRTGEALSRKLVVLH